MLQLKFFCFVLLLWFFGTCFATLSPNDKKTTDKKEIKSQEGPRKHDVYERNLVSEKVLVKDIIKYHSTYYEDTTHRKFNGTVLGYVTPWNPSGYEVAKTWAGKFTHISPTWLVIDRQATNKYIIKGLQDIDTAWMKTLKKKARPRKLKIVPRVLVDNWSPSSRNHFFNEDSEQEALILEVINTCKKWEFDGVVFEFNHVVGRYDQQALKFTSKMGKVLQASSLDFILVYMPFRGHEIDKYYMTQYDNIYKDVTAISLMTYDFSDAKRPGPNAPIGWLDSNVAKLLEIGDSEEKRSKILLGLNFYGFSYTAAGAQPITGKDYIKMLRSAKENQALIYNNEMCEHYIEVKTYKGSQKIFYPTLKSISERVNFAIQHGVGISIWELGQGLDYFMDLL